MLRETWVVSRKITIKLFVVHGALGKMNGFKVIGHANHVAKDSVYNADPRLILLPILTSQLGSNACLFGVACLCFLILAIVKKVIACALKLGAMIFGIVFCSRGGILSQHTFRMSFKRLAPKKGACVAHCLR